MVPLTIGHDLGIIYHLLARPAWILPRDRRAKKLKSALRFTFPMLSAYPSSFAELDILATCFLHCYLLYNSRTLHDPLPARQG